MAKNKKPQPSAAAAPKPRTSPQAAVPGWGAHTRRWSLAFFALSVLLYANTLRHDYALDDAIVITENMFTQAGIAGIPGLLEHDTFYGFFKEAGKANLVAGGRYRPLTPVMFAVERSFFGDSPVVGHLFNALYYGATSVLLYWLLLWLLARSPAHAERGHLIAVLATLLFVVHPVHTEVVANIKGRDEIVTLLCSLGALYLSLRAFAERKGLLSILAGLVFFLGLMAKENAIMLLAIVPLTYYYFTSAKLGKIAAQMLPFVVAAAAFLAIRFSVLGFAMGSASMELMNNPFLKLSGGQYIPFTGAEKLATVLFTLGLYFKLMLFPYPLTHDYYPRHIDLMSFGDWQVLLSLLLHIGLLVLALRGLRQKTLLSYGVWFYLIALSLVSNLVFAVGTNMAERLIFMPGLGLCIAAAALLSSLQARSTTAPLYAAAAIAVIFSVLTISRNPAWKDNYTLFSTDIETSPNSAKLRNAMGGELVTRSVQEPNEAKRQTMCREAVVHLKAAAALHPTYKNAYLLLGNAYNYLQEYDNSIAAYLQALDLDPGYQDANANLAITYRDAGKYAGEKQGNVALALGYLQKAEQLSPNDYEITRLLGVAHGVSGNAPQAIAYFTKCTEISPDNAFAWFDLGSAYGQSGNIARAEECIAKARALDPNIDTKRLQPRD